MGGRSSMFSICKGKQEYIVDSSHLTNINPADKQAYFSEEQEGRYAQIRSEERLPEVEAPVHWQSSEIIGTGSFGKVMFGANLDTGELLAIKEIPLIGLESSPFSITEVAEEVNILSKLSHRNIVRYIGTSSFPTKLNIFMEYVSGGSIASVLHKYGKLNESLIKRYTKQLLEGLEYLHYHSIIHRDIKGANVLLASDGVCKLADFGSAKKILDDNARSFKGTFNWMAPEVVNREGYGRFADIWSLGCLVLEMATGKPPWSHLSNPYLVLWNICKTEELPTIPEELSDYAKDFVLMCLRRTPNHRPNVCQLLAHPFIRGVPLWISIPLKENESPLSKADSKRASEEPNFDTLDPYQSVGAPFGSIKCVLNKEKSITESACIIPLTVSSQSRSSIIISFKDNN